MKLGNKKIGHEHPHFFIAEIGINHNGDLNIAKQLIDGAVEAGCDAVKFQKRTVDVVYSPEELARPRENPFGSTNGHLKQGLEFGKEHYDEIDRYCKEKGIMWLASPWDIASVDFIDKYDLPAYKIASAMAADREFLEHVKAKNKPVIFSTGMMSDMMIDKAINILGQDNLILMHCISTYPAQPEELHLSNIPRFRRRYPNIPIGYSGHEVGVYPSLIAAALGACVIERHITLDRSMWGSDHAASLEIGGLKRLMKELRYLPSYLGEARRYILESEKPIEKKLRRANTL